MTADQKKKFIAAILTTLFLLQLGLFAFVRFYQIPYYRNRLGLAEQKTSQLQAELNSLYAETGLDVLINEFEMKADEVAIFNQARQSVFMFGDDGESFDFTPPLVEIVLPAITRHIHNDVTLEGISINEKAEVVLPMFADGYTALSKQYAAFKKVFDEEEVPLFTNIKLNAFTTQEIEILERDAYRRLVKNRRKVAKATLVASLNPDYFVGGFTEEDLGDLTFDLGKKEKPSLWSRTKYFFSTVGKNMKRDGQTVASWFGAEPPEERKSVDFKLDEESASDIDYSQKPLSEDYFESYEITSDENGSQLVIQVFESDPRTFALDNQAGVTLTPIATTDANKIPRNLIQIGDMGTPDRFYFDMKESAFVANSEKYDVTLDIKNLTITIKEKEGEAEVQNTGEIVTTTIPTFYLNGVRWSLVPQKLSEFLAAGKILKVEDMTISPYETYDEETLISQAQAMMSRLTELTGTVNFHQKSYNISDFGDVVDLVELNK